jgi:hypothetical protein
LSGASTRATFRPVLRTLTQEQASLNSQAAANDSQPARLPSYHAPVTKTKYCEPTYDLANGTMACLLALCMHVYIYTCIHVHTYRYKHRHMRGRVLLTLTSIPYLPSMYGCIIVSSTVLCSHHHHVLSLSGALSLSVCDSPGAPFCVMAASIQFACQLGP